MAGQPNKRRQKLSMPWFTKRKPSPTEAGQVLSATGKWEHKLAVRAQCDRMRAEMGQPPIDWANLR